MISGTLKKYILSRVIPANAMIYVDNNATSQSIPNGTTWTKYTFPNAVTGFKKHFEIDEVTRDVTALKKGRYFLSFNFSSLSDTSNIVLETVLLKNDVAVPSVYMKRQFSGVSIVSHGTLTGCVDLNKGDVLRVGTRHNNGSAINLTVQYGNLVAYKI